MPLGEKVKTLRREANITQQQLSEASGITQATISRIEKGLIKQLKSETLKSLATALCVSSDYLMGTSDKIPLKEAIQLDANAQLVCQCYMELSISRKKQLKDFALFLKEQEERYNNPKRSSIGLKKKKLISTQGVSTP